MKKLLARRREEKDGGLILSYAKSIECLIRVSFICMRCGIWAKIMLTKELVEPYHLKPYNFEGSVVV